MMKLLNEVSVAVFVALLVAIYLWKNVFSETFIPKRIGRSRNHALVGLIGPPSTGKTRIMQHLCTDSASSVRSLPSRSAQVATYRSQEGRQLVLIELPRCDISDILITLEASVCLLITAIAHSGDSSIKDSCKLLLDIYLERAKKNLEIDIIVIGTKGDLTRALDDNQFRSEFQIQMHKLINSYPGLSTDGAGPEDFDIEHFFGLSSLNVIIVGMPMKPKRSLIGIEKLKSQLGSI